MGNYGERIKFRALMFPSHSLFFVCLDQDSILTTKVGTHERLKHSSKAKKMKAAIFDKNYLVTSKLQ